MKIVSDRDEVVFKNEYQGKSYYKLKLAKKDEQGNWQNGYIICRFKKDVSLGDRTHIKIKDAWLDFYIKEKITYPYIFINDFVSVEEEKKEQKDPFEEFGNQIAIEDEDLPF